MNSIRIQRFPYEEPYHVQLNLSAENGRFSGGLDFYTGVQCLKQFAADLQNFPKHIGDEAEFKYGSPRKEDRMYRHLVIRAYTIGGVGRCAIQFTFNNHEDEPDEGCASFSILADAVAINRLGKLLEKFSELQHLELFWSPYEEELYTELQK
ncbi:hypothetical protein [Prosthecobacter sp.]|jgi:hypothetical protein|uniref:hypothetical protein n=1 Tax=Prosthecobacter sp. TaxID=1965333 RepID=UPI0037C55EA6